MPHAQGTKSITIAASGAVLDEIKRRTAGGATSANRAALDLIEQAIAGGTEKPVATIPEAEARTPRQRLVALLDGLSDLMIEQIEAAAAPRQDDQLLAERVAWQARAEEAVAKFARAMALFA